jgi:hypothetical protein
MINMYKIIIGKPEGRRPLARPRHRSEDNIKMDFEGRGWEGVDWIYLTQDRDPWRALVNTLINIRVQ